jgi:hypothetical protein
MSDKLTKAKGAHSACAISSANSGPSKNKLRLKHHILLSARKLKCVCHVARLLAKNQLQYLNSKHLNWKMQLTQNKLMEGIFSCS